MRWPDGIRCPVCGNDKISKITRKTPSKNKRTRIYQCLEPTCKNQFSATAGTIFNDSHLPLTKWFMAIAIIVDAKKGISANQLKEHLGIGSYRTAWYMAHRIRKAMTDVDGERMMTGIVEVDETYIGGKAIRRFKKEMYPKPPKEMVMAIRERGQKGREGRVRFIHIPNGKKETISAVIEKHINPSIQRIYTDSAVVYDFSIKPEIKSRHRAVNHSQEWVVPGSRIHTNTVESSFSLLKRGLIGSFHRVSIKHLHRYLTEFEYRFNARKAADRFSMTLGEMMSTVPMPYAALTADE
jgi:transposase-like protein